MYINPFVAGVLATILAELAIFAVAVFISVSKTKIDK